MLAIAITSSSSGRKSIHCNASLIALHPISYHTYIHINIHSNIQLYIHAIIAILVWIHVHMYMYVSHSCLAQLMEIFAAIQGQGQGYVSKLPCWPCFVAHHMPLCSVLFNTHTHTHTHTYRNWKNMSSFVWVNAKKIYCANIFYFYFYATVSSCFEYVDRRAVYGCMYATRQSLACLLCVLVSNNFSYYFFHS